MGNHVRQMLVEKADESNSEIGIRTSPSLAIVANFNLATDFTGQSNTGQREVT